MTMTRQTWVIINDIQIPFEDSLSLWELVVPFICDLRPHGIILNGDIVDHYEISDYPKNPRLKPYSLARERKGLTRLMKTLAPVTKERIYLGGNHEDRYRRRAWKSSPEFDGAGALMSFPEYFHVKDYGFTWRPYGGHWMLGKLMVTHGFIVRQHSAYSAKAHWDRLGTSVLTGHTHRGGVYYGTNKAGPHAAYENFCLCRLDGLGYVQFPDWQQGFSVVDVFDDRLFNVQQVPVLGRKQFMFGGQLVRRK